MRLREGLMKVLVCLLVIISFSHISIAQERNNNDNLDIPLTDEEVRALDNLSDANVKFEDVVLPNGEKALVFLCKHDRKYIEDFNDKVGKNIYKCPDEKQ